MGIADRFEARKQERAFAPSKTQDWIDCDPKSRKKYLDEAADWFLNRGGKDHRFGVRSLAEMIREDHSDFPRGWQHLKLWLERTHGRS